ncbi:solute carrier organic anion transporter family member 4C1-like [Mya arenaria]|uniref:solute carrier organic anion transporter family member 4C1-like n=1 Tax=Mya arenaria TaxID=6604 RepID=UPI0022E126EA|nr:solute carrier organic anion transporter family member 4C1-like [Mya arenaria]
MADKYIEVEGENHPEKYETGTEDGHDRTLFEVRDFDPDAVTPEHERQEGTRDSKQVPVETRCGYYSCRPVFLQRLNNPPMLCCCLCVYTLVHGFAINGINNVNTTSYERRFDLTSSSVGWITSSYDISAATCGVVIGFYGSRRRKGRILTLAFILSSLGSTCMYLPHFITPSYEWGQEKAHLCSEEESKSPCVETNDALSNFLVLFVLGQLLHGIGGSTLITVGYSFIDDSVPAASSPMYISIIGLCQMLGPMIGFLVGGTLQDMYVDFDRIPESKWRLTPADPRWVGAWWVGFVVSSILMLVFSLSFTLFGAELPSTKHVRETRISETHTSGRTSPPYPNPSQPDDISVRQFPVLLCRLLHNPAFVCVAFGGAFMGLVTVSVATFLPKYIQNIYGTTASAAATYAGLIIIPGAAAGQMFGGLAIRRWKLKVRGILRLTILIVLLASLSKACFFINCDMQLWNTTVNDSTPISTERLTSCNADCHCDDSVFQVVCEPDGRKFYSPCLAGCQAEIGEHEFSDCKCVTSGTNGTSSVSVSSEYCVPTTCNSLLYIFLFIIFLSAFFVSASTVPALTVVLRCAGESERTFALGLLNFIARLVGTIPGPILYGTAIDSTCQVWGRKCGHDTSCWQYNKARMGEYLAGLGMGFTGIAICFFTLALKLYKPPPLPHKKEVAEDGASERLSDTDMPNGICGAALPTVEFPVEETTRL